MVHDTVTANSHDDGPPHSRRGLVSSTATTNETPLLQGVVLLSDVREDYYEYVVLIPTDRPVDYEVLSLMLAAGGLELIDESADDYELTEKGQIKMYCTPTAAVDW